MIEMPLLWLSILALILGLAPFSPSLPWLLAPYLAWVSFAMWINWAIIRLNGSFGRAANPRSPRPPAAAMPPFPAARTAPAPLPQAPPG